MVAVLNISDALENIGTTFNDIMATLQGPVQMLAKLKEQLTLCDIMMANMPPTPLVVLMQALPALSPLIGLPIVDAMIHDYLFHTSGFTCQFSSTI